MFEQLLPAETEINTTLLSDFTALEIPNSFALALFLSVHVRVTSCKEFKNISDLSVGDFSGN